MEHQETEYADRFVKGLASMKLVIECGELRPGLLRVIKPSG